MNTNKKYHDEKLKEFRSVFNEQLKAFDYISELNKSTVFEVSDYCRRRSELEAEYSRNLNKLNEKLTDKLEKIKQTYRITESNEKLKTGCLKMMSFLSSEASVRASTALLVSDHFLNTLTQMAVKYNEICGLKLTQIKDIHNGLYEEIVTQLSTVFEKRLSYTEAFAVELRSNKKFVLQREKESKSKKQTKQSQEKVDKFYENFMECIQKTDSCRNLYIVNQHALQGVLDRLIGQQIPDLVLLLHYKFGDFASSFKKELCDLAIKQCDVYLNKVNQFNDVKFTDFAESEFSMELCPRSFFDTNLKVSMLPATSDIVSGLMLSGYVKEEMIEMRDNLQKRCLDLVESMSEVSLEVMKMQEVELNWSQLIRTSDASKGSKSKPLLNDSFVPYYKQAKAYVLNDTMLHLLKTELNQISGTLESPFAQQKTRLPKQETRKISDDIFQLDIQKYFRETSEKIPDILITCVKYIYDQKGYTLQGLFRISSSSVQFNAVKECLLEGKEIEKLDINIFAIANVLKQFLRGLKNLIPQDVFTECLSEDIEKSDFVSRTRNMFEKLPIPSKELLLFLFKFLNFISTHSEKNKMDASNLSIVFGPTIFPCPIESPEAVKMQNIANVFVKNAIEGIYTVFPNESPLFEMEEMFSNEIVLVDIHDLEQDDLYSAVTLESESREDITGTDPSSSNANLGDKRRNWETKFSSDMPSFSKISTSSTNEPIEHIKEIKRTLSIGHSVTMDEGFDFPEDCEIKPKKKGISSDDDIPVPSEDYLGPLNPY